MSGERAVPAAGPAFYAPRAGEAPDCFALEAVPELCVGPPERQFLMGGVGLASAIAALEAVTGRALVWATAQYLSYAQPGDRLDLSVDVPVSGRRLSQARVVGRVGDREILSVAGALGARSDDRCVQFAHPPEAPAPEACATRSWRHEGLDNLIDRFERREVVTDEATGHVVHWIRSRPDVELDAGLVAIVADFFAAGIDGTVGAMSLDNTIRIHRLPETTPAGWLLCDTHFAGLHAGSFHGEMRIFDAAGALLATASQSAMLPRAPSGSRS